MAAEQDFDPRIVHWLQHEPTQNFGDYLSELFATALLRFPKVEADAYHLVGSVIDEKTIRRDLRALAATRHGRVAFWGCGVRAEAGLAPAYRAMAMIFGVRGPISRAALRLPEDTPMGDPGLLAPLVHAPRPIADGGRTICIPHFHDPRGDEALRGLAGTDAVVRPRIARSIEALRALLDVIAGADFVLSASLHGAIIACAYGRPFAFWDNGHLDLPLKWQDFSRSIGIDARFHPTLDQARRGYEAVAARITLPPRVPMLEVCPFTVRPDCLLQALALDGRAEAAALEPARVALAALDTAGADRRAELTAASAAHRAMRTSAGVALTAAWNRLVGKAKAFAKRLAGRS